MTDKYIVCIVSFDSRSILPQIICSYVLKDEEVENACCLSFGFSASDEIP
jgi:hypothetical protein